MLLGVGDSAAFVLVEIPFRDDGMESFKLIVDPFTMLNAGPSSNLAEQPKESSDDFGGSDAPYRFGWSIAMTSRARRPG